MAGNLSGVPPVPAKTRNERAAPPDYRVPDARHRLYPGGVAGTYERHLKKMIFPILDLLINLVLFVQFSHLSLVAWLRIKSGKNGITPYLLLISLSLMAMVALDAIYQVAILTEVMGNPAVMAPLQGIDVVIRTVLVVGNAVYFIAIRAEATAPLRRMTSTRDKLYKIIEDKK